MRQQQRGGYPWPHESRQWWSVAGRPATDQAKTTASGGPIRSIRPASRVCAFCGHGRPFKRLAAGRICSPCWTRLLFRFRWFSMAVTPAPGRRPFGRGVGVRYD